MQKIHSEINMEADLGDGAADKLVIDVHFF